MQTIIMTYFAHQVKAMHFCLKLKDERNGRPKTETIDDDPLTDERVCTYLINCLITLLLFIRS